jgi:hypothetical protein
MTYSPDWTVEEPPTDRQFLALAVAAGMLDEPVMVVAEWDKAADGWRPVKIPGDTMIGIRLNIVCWTELPEAPLVG